MRHRELLMFLCAGMLASAGCTSKHIVRASPPPSVSVAPVEEAPPPPEPPAPPPVEASTEPPPEPEAPAAVAPPAPAKLPAPRPRPAQPQPSEAAAPAQPKPTPPQISPQLSARDLAAAQRNTNSNIGTAENNLKATAGKQLNAAQNDLVEKIHGFVAQAKEAILADDWVRADNLADKARVLSVELVKSF